VLGGCQVSPPPRLATVPFDPAFQVESRDLETPEAALLWNGLIGVRFRPDGSGELYDIRRYQTGGEQEILPLPSPFMRPPTLQGKSLLPENGQFVQSLDVRTGVHRMVWTTTAGGQTVQVTLDTVLHPDRRTIAQRWEILGSRPLEVEFWPGAPALEGLNERSIKVGRSGMRIESASAFPHTVEWTSRYPTPQQLTAEIDRIITIDTNTPPTTFPEVAAAMKQFLSGPNAPDIVIEGPAQDQIAIRTMLFYLRTAVHPQGGRSVAPMALSSRLYKGHVFWDADIWVFPALALLEPDRARAIADYRLRMRPQAAANFREWVAAGRPTGGAPMGPLPNAGPGVKYPWESSVDGRETVPGPSRFQDHITGSVAWSLAYGARLGLVPKADAEVVRREAATFFAARSVPSATGRQIPRTMSPDEHHTGDNDLYTNLLALWCTDPAAFAKGNSAGWYLPKDDRSFLTYDNDQERGYKQAAALLAVYPLQYPPAEKQAKVMFERFSPKTIKSGPAMSDSIHAIIAARIGERQRAQELFRNAYLPFLRDPAQLFSEKRSSSRTYFVTGAAGVLQSVLYGFAGLRVDGAAPPGAEWQQALPGGGVLSARPALPPDWKSLTLQNIVVDGKRHSVTFRNPTSPTTP